MRVILHARSDAPPMQALRSGLEASGVRADWCPQKYWTPADVRADASAVVVVGLHGAAVTIRAQYQAMGVPVWVADTARLRMELHATGFFLGGLHWLPDAPCRPTPPTPGLLKSRGEAVLVCAQMPGDAAHGMDGDDVDAWMRETVAAVRAATARPVLVRRHPHDHRRRAADAYGADGWSEALAFRDALVDAHAVVTYNSTAGWEAIDAGVPVVALAPAAEVAYRDYCATDLAGLDALAPLARTARKAALARVASTQWTVEELADGRAIAAMQLLPAEVAA